ncbi:hypothetical protein [Streptomyces lavendulae]|uniref:hypothetical protein n=1 Tax=Streptomyces lavendulae TaxID=1914 RepID=UPI0024A44547|nr:hypothetical protein [Streptomyces lavendulae]GLX22438.1 hypothetical protein Slala01_60820 [Streptomyces lavendulae subsp. lavendulae]GLX29922.1 hypothetical protein Slala02_57420 [Streptomyces lavendulae subsp. lavendulae]
MSKHQTDQTALIGPLGQGRALVPGDAGAHQLAAVLKRALHTVECRELGPEAASQKFGRFADTTVGPVTVLVDEEQIRHRHASHDELHHLMRAVRERGPAVGVLLVPSKPIVLVMDEMAHIASKAAEPASGTALAGPTRWAYEPSWPMRPLRWLPGVEREEANER